MANVASASTSASADDAKGTFDQKKNQGKQKSKAKVMVVALLAAPASAGQLHDLKDDNAIIVWCAERAKTEQITFKGSTVVKAIIMSTKSMTDWHALRLRGDPKEEGIFVYDCDRCRNRQAISKHGAIPQNWETTKPHVTRRVTGDPFVDIHELLDTV